MHTVRLPIALVLGLFTTPLLAGDDWQPFQTVSRPDPPVIRESGWARNPIDRFVAAERESRNLPHRPEAPRHVLLRRAYLDLIGLQPTPQELQAFVADNTPDAYERVVDRLLNDPRYGERWGRHWMDIWRYSDWAGWTGGNQIRDSQPHIWRWRDWIIESLNADKPYDRMVVEMLAGDEVAPTDPDVLRATGYLVRNYKMLSRETWLQETVKHTAQAFLGLTLDCARCHEHKYDPIAQQDYYRFRAFFEPHNVRTDRLPGEPDVKKDGLVRVFDADPGVPTYLFVRGDDRTPDKDHPIECGVPAALGKTLPEIKPVALPLTAYVPEKIDYVVAETLEASARAAAEGRTALETAAKNRDVAESAVARQSDSVRQLQSRLAELRRPSGDGSSRRDDETKRELDAAQQAFDEGVASLAKVQDAARKSLDDWRFAILAADAAAARHSALDATVRVEKFEDEGRREREPQMFQSLATLASSTQNWATLLECKRDQRAAERAVDAAQAAATAAERSAAEKPSDKKLQDASQKAATDVTNARNKLTETDAVLAKAKQASLVPPTAVYTKRPLKAYPASSTGRRLALARWIADPANPLTARVAVNHIWNRHMGTPLVPSVFDFGAAGRAPTHPALVDWLAAELMQPSDESAAPWSMKHLHRLILTSATYRMASTPDDSALATDPDNRYLWRMNSRRLEAELVRDNVLWSAGKLDGTFGGPDIDHDKGMTVYRRSMYFRHAAEKQMEFMKIFDAAGVNECYERKECVVPQQALAMANSELTIVLSRLLARSMERRHTAPGDFIGAAFETVLARPATPDELAACSSFLENQALLFRANRSEPSAGAADPADGSRPASDPTQRARENLVHALMNHNDFVTVR
jgi:hypothetical protein